MTTTFLSILEKGKIKELRPFLEALNGAQKKELVPTIKKLAKEYLTYQPVVSGNTTRFHQKADEWQRQILWITAFVCMSRADFQKIESADWILQENVLDKVIDWYCPDWFNDFVNGLGSREFMPFFLRYEYLMKLAEKGYLRLEKELVVKLLPPVIHERRDQLLLYVPEKLLIWKATLEEHLWWMFELPSFINWIGSATQAGETGKAGETDWIAALIKFSTEGRIDRRRLLEEALLASNRNFNKNLTGWFTGLFLELDPTGEEIIGLQKLLLSVLSSPHSKTVHGALQCLKKIAGAKAFMGRDFLDHVPVLLSTDKKNVMTSAVAVLEKLAKTQSDLRVTICELLTQVFMHTDEQLQLRAAKLIDKYRAGLDGAFRDFLLPYQAGMMSGPRGLLGDLLSPAGGDEHGVDKKEDDQALWMHPPVEEERVPLPPVGDIDDLVFLASQAFDHNESWHIDLLPAALIEWNHKLTGETIARLEPALQRALQMTKDEFRSNEGLLDHMMAIFFIDVCICLVRRSPAEAAVLKDLLGKFDQKDGEKTRRWLAIGEGSSYIAKWAGESKEPYYKPHQQLLMTALDKIRRWDRLPMLSTPTHAPGWIDPMRLIERMAAYQEAGVCPVAMDLQVAVSRCLVGVDGTIAMAETKLSGELRDLMLFLLGPPDHAEPVGPFQHLPAWVCVSLARTEKKHYPALEKAGYDAVSFAHYTAAFSWESVDEETTYKYNHYDQAQKKWVNMTGRQKILRIDFGPRPVIREVHGFQKWVAGFFSKDSKLARALEPPPDTLYDYFTIKATYLANNEYNDIRRILLLAPHNPDPFLARITGLFLQFSTNSGEGYKRSAVAALQVLYEIWEDGGEMAYLFLGTCLLSSDKTAANIAAEIWLKACAAGKMDNARLGKVIGIHERVEFAPLKRLTDLMAQQLLLVSPFYNKNLQALIAHILVELPDVPVKGLKKLLGIYAELVAMNGVGDDAISPGGMAPGAAGGLVDKLSVWKETEGLEKIVRRVQD